MISIFQFVIMSLFGEARHNSLIIFFLVSLFGEARHTGKIAEA